jgi:hypothetical protein
LAPLGDEFDTTSEQAKKLPEIFEDIGTKIDTAVMDVDTFNSSTINSIDDASAGG